MIDRTAIVDPDSDVAASVSVGPYSVIGPRVSIGEGSRLLAHVVAFGPTRIGARVIVHPFAVLGGEPQDRTFEGEPTELAIGDDTVIREHVTLHRGTRKDRGKTSVGARCLIMVSVHVAHDVVIGDDCTIANAAQLAGHCVLEDGVVLGGAAALAPFVRIGEGAFVAAGACVEHDVPPYHIVQGDRARVRALNVIGLRRRNVDGASIAALERAHRMLYRSSEPIGLAVERLDLEDPYVRRLAEFIRTRRTLPGPRK